MHPLDHNPAGARHLRLDDSLLLPGQAGDPRDPRGLHTDAARHRRQLRRPDHRLDGKKPRLKGIRPEADAQGPLEGAQGRHRRRRDSRLLRLRLVHHGAIHRDRQQRRVRRGQHLGRQLLEHGLLRGDHEDISLGVADRLPCHHPGEGDRCPIAAHHRGHQEGSGLGVAAAAYHHHGYSHPDRLLLGRDGFLPTAGIRTQKKYLIVRQGNSIITLAAGVAELVDAYV